MNKYELVVIVDATISQEDKEATIKDTIDTIDKCEGKLIGRQVWLEKHRFSFPMKKRWEGTYYILNFESSSAGVNKLRQLLKIKDKVLRSLIIRIN